jgi:hypothetical protein
MVFIVVYARQQILAKHHAVNVDHVGQGRADEVSLNERVW